MSKKIVSFQGLDGAYSDLVCKKFYSDFNTLPCNTFQKTLDAVANGAADTTVLFQSEFQSSTLSKSAFWVAFSQDRLTSSEGLDSGASFSKWFLLTPCASGFTIFLYILFLQLSLQGNPILLIFTPW